MTEEDFWGRPQPLMIDLCHACDGLGHDDDLLCPMPCDRCKGTGFEPDDDEYPDDEPIAGDDPRF